MAAVDDLFTQVSENTLLNKPGFQPLRKELLGRALEYYQRFLKQRSGDPRVQDELASAHFRIGLITEQIESTDQALPLYESAREMQERLVKATPHNPARLEAYGNTLNALASAGNDLALFNEQERTAARDKANGPQKAQSEIDVAVVFDTTGSMGDELSYLQTEFDSIAQGVHDKFPAVTPRWGLVLYRDKGDAYVTQKFDFTTDTTAFRANLAKQSAGGGGDIPEAVVQGLETTATLSWRQDDIAKVQGQVHAQSVQKVGELAERNPHETAAIIRQWLTEPA